MARHDAHLNNLSHVCAEPNQALEHGTKRGPGLSRPSTWPNKKPRHASLISASTESQPRCDRTELDHQRRPHPTADPVTRAVRTEAIRPHAAVGSAREGDEGASSQHCCHTGAEGRAGPSRVEAAAMAPPRQAVQRGPCGPGGRCVAPLPHQPAGITCPAPLPSLAEPNSNCPHPASRHQEGTQPSAAVGPTRLPPAACPAASPLSLPVKERELLERAKALQHQLLDGPDTVHLVKTTLTDELSTDILQAMTPPAQQVDWSTAEEEPAPMVCIPCDRGGGLQHLPPPLLFDKGGKWVWKPSSWPWHTVAQQWGKVAWAAYVKPHLVLGLQLVGDPEPTADDSNRNPESHAAPNLLNRSPLQNGELVGQVAAAAEAPTPVDALHASLVGSSSHSDQHAGEDVHGPADQAGPGCRGGGLRHDGLDTVTPLQQACLGLSASNSMGEELAQPDVDPTANLTAAQPTAASSPSLTQATDTGSSVQPDCRQEEGAPPYVAFEPAYPPVTLGGQLVLGLRAAAGSGSAAPGPASLATPEAWTASAPPPPPNHLQGQGAQQASPPGEGQAGAPETVAAPPAHPVAPPCGPKPLDGLQGGPDTAPGPDAVLQAHGAEAMPPTPSHVAWCNFNVHPRSLQELLKDQTQRFGLEGCAADTEVSVHVVLVFPLDQPCNNDYGSLEVIYKAERRSGEKSRWGLTVANGSRRTIPQWVKKKGLQLTGKYKAHRGPVVTGPHRLEVQVQPLTQEATQTGQSTGDAEGSLDGAGPSQADAAPAPAAGGTAGASSGLNRKSTGGGAGQAEGAGVAEPAPAGLQQDQQPAPPPAGSGPGAEWQPPPAAAPAPAEEEACRTAKGTADMDQGQSQRSGQGLDDGERMETDGGAAQVSGSSAPSSPEGHVDAGSATAGDGVGTAEEGGPGPSHAAAGMEGVAFEGDPVMPLPAGGPTHAGVPGSNGQAVTDPMSLTHEEPGVEQEHGEWHTLITSIVSFLHAHLPDTQHQNVAEFHLRMIQWRDSIERGVHLHALAAAHAATQSECVGQEAAHTAWFMWKSMLRLMSADVTA